VKTLAVVSALAFAGWAQVAKPDFEFVPQPVIQQRLEDLSTKAATRRGTLEALFRDAGCEVSEQKVPGSKEPNVICVLAAEDADAPVIVTGGHFDLVEQGTGAVDDWSGVVLLPSLYQGLKRAPRKHTYVFIGFAAEETGLNGSTEYVKRLSKPQRAAVSAMINLECLGLTTPKVWASRADKHLLDAYSRVAKALGMEAQASNPDNVGDDDSHPFLNAKIPVLTIHSVTTETLPVLHSPRDRLNAIRPADYYATYRLVAALLEYLDR
jgi:hypothetical protein